ncbi:MAG: hypothetical protein M0010_08395 [Actinomycetota bacterium]|nr:hypothetical protein [Actinomycetota bacterium]
MTRQHWSTTNKLAAQRSADLRRLATLRHRGETSALEEASRQVLPAPGRILLEGGWRLRGDGSPRNASRRRAA